MFFKPKRQAGSQKKDKVEAPYEVRKRLLAEKEAQVRAEQERLEEAIKSAPQRAENQRQKQRELFIRNASKTEPRPSRGMQLPDNRHYVHNEAVISPRSRSRHQQKGKWLFFFLVAVLIALGVWAWFFLFHPTSF